MTTCYCSAETPCLGKTDYKGDHTLCEYRPWLLLEFEQNYVFPFYRFTSFCLNEAGWPSSSRNRFPAASWTRCFWNSRSSWYVPQFRPLIVSGEIVLQASFNAGNKLVCCFVGRVCFTVVCNIVSRFNNYGLVIFFWKRLVQLFSQIDPVSKAFKLIQEKNWRKTKLFYSP